MTTPVKIHADIHREDRLIANLTARQVAILAGTGLGLYAVWIVLRTVVPPLVFVIAALPVAALAATLALGQRDGLSLDRLLLAALRQRLNPRHRVAVTAEPQPVPAWLAAQATTPTGQPVEATRPPTAPLHAPVKAVSAAGVADLGGDGLAVVAACGTLNFALRTPTEQEALVAAFGRYLHSLAAPVQILVRTHHLDLSAAIANLRENAPTLPHPALEDAACDHADYLAHLAAQSDLLRRHVLLILREPHPDTPTTSGAHAPQAGLGWLARRRGPRARSGATRVPDEASRRRAEDRLVRRLDEALALLAPAGIVVTPLDAARATAVLAGACNPTATATSPHDLAAPQEIITAHRRPDTEATTPDETNSVRWSR